MYLISGLLFGLGLCISGMIDPMKIKNFLTFGETWNPSLMFVLGSAVPVYFLSFLILRKRKKTFKNIPFEKPAARPVNKKLIIGSVIFGIGWGISGICPGPALVHTLSLDSHYMIFLLTMFLGFEIQRRFEHYP